jgi:NADP-dependent 3-hydroxy acid dehydrogenase YdfG
VITPSLEGRTAIVTGASRGIGLAIARAFLGQGARVALLARSAEVLEREAAAWAGRALAVPCDLANGGDVDRALSAVAQWLGTPDVLVNNAGAFALAPVGAIPAGDAERLVDVNLLAPLRLVNAVVPAMKQRGRGHLVTIGSIADRHTYAENAAYAATKFGARALHQVVREELRGTAVRVSLVSPGPVDTELWDPIVPEARPGFTPRAAMLRAEDVAEAVLWVVTRPPSVNVDELRLGRT